MKKINKSILFIASFIGLGFSIGILSLLYPIPLLTYEVKRCLELFPFLNDVFTGFLSILCICFFMLSIMILLFPNQSDNVVIMKSKGRLQFSKQTIESTVRYSFADFSGINSSKVKAKIHKQPEKIKVYVKLSLNDSIKLVGMTESIQERIHDTLESSLGIHIKSIHIKVVEFNPDGVGQVNNEENTAIESRVI